MPVKLFVGGLSFSTSNESLHAAFARFGAVTSAIVMTDRATGRSRGFGFVEMGTDQEAERAISSLNGSQLDGRMIRVDKATPRGAAPARRPGGPGVGGFAPRGPGGGAGFAPRGPSSGGFAPRGPGGGFAPRGPGGGGGGGFDPGASRAPGGTRRGAGQGQGRDRGRPGGEGDSRRPGKKSGKPTNERRAGDKGRRSEEGYRW